MGKSSFVCSLFAAWMGISALLLPISHAAVHMEKVAESDYQWTGIAISPKGRMFVNFPTWNDYPANYRVVELKNGKETAYPNEEWNKEFVCVQSVVADEENHL